MRGPILVHLSLLSHIKSTKLNYFFNLANSELFITTQPSNWVSNYIYSIMELHNYDK